jgi:hypothetical protein
MSTTKKYIQLAEDGERRTVLCAIAEPVAKKYLVVVGDIFKDENNDIRFRTKQYSEVHSLLVSNYPAIEFRAVTMKNRKVLNALCSIKNIINGK